MHEKRMRFDTTADSATVSSKDVFLLKSEKCSRLEYFKFFVNSFKEDTKLKSKYCTLNAFKLALGSSGSVVAV